MSIKINNRLAAVVSIIMLKSELQNDQLELYVIALPPCLSMQWNTGQRW
jgi:hypothetical protein